MKKYYCEECKKEVNELYKYEDIYDGEVKELCRDCAERKASIKQSKNMNSVVCDFDMSSIYDVEVSAAKQMVKFGALVNIIACRKSRVNSWLEHLRKHYTSGEMKCTTEHLIFDLTHKEAVKWFPRVVEKAIEPNWIEDELTGEVYPGDGFPFMIFGVIDHETLCRSKELRGWLPFQKITLMIDEFPLMSTLKEDQLDALLELYPSNVLLLRDDRVLYFTVQETLD